MIDHQNFCINYLQGYSGIRLKNNEPLVFKPSINLLIGRNGSGKSNLIRLIHFIATNNGDVSGKIESSFFQDWLIKYKSETLEQHDKPGKNISGPNIVEHSFKGNEGRIELVLKNIPQEHVINNLLEPGASLQGHIDLKQYGSLIKIQSIQGNINSVKFEMSGYINTKILSGDHNNIAHKAIEGPIKVVSDLISEKILEFYRSDDFASQIIKLESSINETLQAFLGTTNKKVKINLIEQGSQIHISVSLMDKDNYINSADMSFGEITLVNLIFSLKTIPQNPCEILTMDEPEIHMHEDMIEVLVGELLKLSDLIPHMIIVIATHSTPFIEQLAKLGKKINIISFDSDRNVSNDKNEGELITALSRNGVRFSTLMLSKRWNIFIENQLVKGKDSRDFFLNFFDKRNLPNIIPIGHSGNVGDSASFAAIFEEILSVNNLRSIGIMDGDIWFRKILREYLTDKEKKVKDVVDHLKKNNDMYIKHEMNQKIYYFNFWEIENLYLFDDLLSFWRNPASQNLNSVVYYEMINSNMKVIIDEYLKTFYKSIVLPRVYKNIPVESMRSTIEKEFSKMQLYLTDDLPSRVESLILEIIENRLFNWLPGKEIKKLVESNGYNFSCSSEDVENLNVSKKLRLILKE